MKTRRLPLALLASFALLVSLAALALPAIAQPAGSHVVELSVEGVVDPFLASYMEQGLADAEAGGAAAVLVRIDTPGGLSSSMREIIQAILGSRTPVICWVGPEGARAASAGTFILIACPVAAMAPGTNVGAAHPVGVSGAIESAKAENDAAAYIRSLAEQRDRNADWAEDAVRTSVSATAEEALGLDVIDLIAADRGLLLAEVDGRSVTVAGGGTATLETAGAEVRERGLGLGASILHGLLSPDLAFLFFFIGMGLLVVEFLNPGVSVPGVLGALMLFAAFVSFGLLPVTLVGLVLLVASAVAFLVDLKAPGSGAATVVGMITLVLGGLFLFDASVPNARVSYPTIAAVGVLLALFFGVTVNKVLAARKRPVEAGIEAVVGQLGVAETDLDPAGMVRARGESWSAFSSAGSIPRGASVRVRSIQRLRLEVEPSEVPAPSEEAMKKGSEAP